MTRLLPALLLGASLAALSAPASAQVDDRRVQRLEQQVRELRSIVFQGRDTGQPVEVKPDGPDPQVTALEAKVDELQQQIRAQTGQMEVLGHDLDEARRTSEQLKADAAARRQAVEDRLARLEAQNAPAPAAPPPLAVEPPPPPPLPETAARRPTRGDATTRAQAGDTSRLGDPAATTAAPADAFADAYQRLSDADYAGAQTGFEGYIAANPTGPRAPEARYYLGQSLFSRDSFAPAARAYAEALKGWPKSKWAPDATVRLAQSLQSLGRPAQACAALGEFDRRYAPASSAAVKSRAASTRSRAACAAG